MSIFQNSVLKTFKQDEKLVALRWASFQNYKTKIEAIKDFKEEVIFLSNKKQIINKIQKIELL